MKHDPIVAEVIAGSLVYASEEMGIAVRNAAYSPNIKERLDHSCALFDAAGRLIAQAEHIPVHLGSLPWGLAQTLAAIRRSYGEVASGEMWVVNDPYLSGTHLNDVTVVRPIFFGGTLAGFAANKAHHADIGGSVPGSISTDASDLFAEGLVVPPLRLMRDDTVVAETVELFRANSRTPDARSGDMRAQATWSANAVCSNFSNATARRRATRRSSAPWTQARSACGPLSARSATGSTTQATRSRIPPARRP